MENCQTFDPHVYQPSHENAVQILGFFGMHLNEQGLAEHINTRQAATGEACNTNDTPIQVDDNGDILCSVPLGFNEYKCPTGTQSAGKDWQGPSPVGGVDKKTFDQYCGKPAVGAQPQPIVSATIAVQPARANTAQSGGVVEVAAVVCATVLLMGTLAMRAIKRKP